MTSGWLRRSSRECAQPRKRLGDLDDLKQSIQEHGILQPVVVSPLSEGKYRLIVGERRFTSAWGPAKKEAEQAAAKLALRDLANEYDDPTLKV